MRLNKDDRRRINRYLDQCYTRYMKSAVDDTNNPSNQKYYLGLYIGACNLLKTMCVNLTPFSNVMPTQILEEKNNE